MRKVLIFSTSYLPKIGGAEIAVKSITDRLPDYDFSIITGLYDSNLPREEEIGNARVFRVGSWAHFSFIFPKALLPLAMFLKARKLWLETGHFDIIFASQTSQAGGAAWLLKVFGYPAPFILNFQEGKELNKQNFLIRYFRKLIIQKTDFITVISSYLGEELEKLEVPRSKIQKIPNGVDVEYFSKEISYGEASALKDKLGIRPGEKVIISVSRLVPKNGLDTLVKAMSYLPNDCKLLLVGDGNEKTKLNDLAWRHAVHKKVIFAGSVDYYELYKYLKISNVFVRPARSEGLGNAFLEAMAAGIPVIGTPVGGIPEFLRDGQTGLMIEPEDTQSLAAQIEKLLNDQTLKGEIVKNAFETVKHFSWDGIAQDYDHLLWRLTPHA